jgi:Domain of unknown function (DUF5666)
MASGAIKREIFSPSEALKEFTMTKLVHITQPIIRITQLSIAVSLGLSLLACGGGSGPDAPVAANNASTTDGSVYGAVTGFGSVIVDGVKFDDSNTKVKAESSADAGVAMSTASLKLGMQVELKHANASASDIVVASNFRGQVTSINLTTNVLSLLGQDVTLDAEGADATVLDGFKSLADIKTGDWVEIHAVENATGSFKATRIERESSTESIAVRATGKVASFDSTAKTFKLGTITVNFSSADIRPATATLANDLRVRVFSDTAPVNGVINAKRVKVRNLEIPKDLANAQVGGLVTDYVSASNFKVAGITVDASAAKFENGAANDIVNGAAVRIKGAIVASVLKAREIEFKKKEGSQAAEVSITGAVTDFLNLTQFTVRGQTIDASGATFEQGKSSDLALGSFVQIKAKLVGGKVVASSIKFVTPQALQKPSRIGGLIKNYDATAKTLTVAGFTVKLTDATVFEGGTIANVVNDATAELTLKANGDILEIVKIQFKGLELPKALIQGIAQDVTATSLSVESIPIAITSQTKFSSGLGTQGNAPLAALVNGVRVIVLTQKASDGSLQAVAIELLPRFADAFIALEGAVSDFVSASDLRVATQKVDASKAVFDGGVITDLANGKRVKIVGSIVDGVVVATAVKFR